MAIHINTCTLQILLSILIFNLLAQLIITKHKKTILLPVVEQAWIKRQSAILKQMKQSISVDVCGDRRCDSPGHSAKYGTYTLMNEKTNLIIEFSVVQVTEVTSSNAMENLPPCPLSDNARINT